ncbi:17592_t:CDS:2, partial [Cetraspora pellucida]
MVEIIENQKEIIRSSINLIWKATNGGIKEIVFNNQSCSAEIFLSDGTENTEHLNTPGVVLISEETYRKIFNDLANMKGKESIASEDDLYSDNLSQVDELMFDAQASKNDTLNLKEGQRTEDSHINDYFKTSKRTKNSSKYPHVNENQEQRINVNNDVEETDKLLPDSHLSINVTDVNNDFESNEKTDALLPNSHSSINVTINTSQAVGIDNQISIDNECITDNQQAENNGKSIEPMLSDEEVDELLLDSYSQINIAVNTSQTVSTDNQISLENEYATDNQ